MLGCSAKSEEIRITEITEKKTKESAISVAREIVNSGHASSVVVHNRDGTISRTIKAGYVKKRSKISSRKSSSSTR